MSKNIPKTSELEKRRKVGRELKAKYEYHKLAVLRLEKENFDHIFIIKTADGWHKIFAHSAVLYKYYIAPIAKERVKEGFKTPKLLSDEDFKDRASIGVMNIRDLGVLRVVLEKCGATEDKTVPEADGDWLIAYRLNHKMSEKEFWAMEKEEKELWDKANRIIVPKAVYPNLGIDIQETTKLFYHVIRKQDRSFIDLVGRRTIELVGRLYTGLILAEKGRTKWETFFTTALSIVAQLDAIILSISSMKLVENTTVIRMADSLSRLELDIENALKSHKKGLGDGEK